MATEKKIAIDLMHERIDRHSRRDEGGEEKRRKEKKTGT